MSKLREYLKNNFSAKRPSTFVVSVKRNKDGMLDELNLATSFLNEAYSNPSVNQRLFHFINDVNTVLTCKYCQNPLQPKLYNARLTGKYYNGTCKNLECRKKLNSDNSRNGCLEKHGVVNISQTEQWREKVKRTNLERRGVEWNTQSKEFLETFRNISLKKYGANHPMQNEKVFNSRMYKLKPYVFPSGKVVQMQGYEWKCLDELLLNEYQEEDIIVGNVEISDKIGSIYYEHNGKNHRYYPDIYIVSENRVIEVKSTYTVKKDSQINNKKDAVLKRGLKYSLKIY